MNWTRVAPTVPGFYWRVSLRNEVPEVFRVENWLMSDGGLSAWGCAWNDSTSLDDPGYLWAGPIEAPPLPSL
jgi:hypothetical protein